MAQRTKKSVRRQVVISSEDKVFVGYDAHKKDYKGTIRVNGQIHQQGVIPPTYEAVCRQLEPYKDGLCAVVFEAGPTGFTVPRALQQAGYPVLVCAPGKTPQAANPSAKTDRLDSAKLAQLAEAGLLKKVAIPTEQQEADRQIVRLREQQVKKIRRAKQQIKSFLLYHGVAIPKEHDSWSAANRQWLRGLSLPEELRFTLDAYLDELEMLVELEKRTDRQIRKLSETKRHAQVHDLLQTHPGVGLITAMTFLGEVFDPKRFNNRMELTSYLGLAPQVRQSGARRKDGPLMKSGRPELRRLLVQACWQWIARDEDAQKVFKRLMGNTGNPQKALIGMARRMAINLWNMAVRREEYRKDAA